MNSYCAAWTLVDQIIYGIVLFVAVDMMNLFSFRDRAVVIKHKYRFMLLNIKSFPGAFGIVK